jgi:hypothetical protein
MACGSLHLVPLFNNTLPWVLAYGYGFPDVADFAIDNAPAVLSYLSGKVVNIAGRGSARLTEVLASRPGVL